MRAEHRAILLMSGFALLWTVVEFIAGEVLREYSPYQVVWTRYGVHLVFMIALWGWRNPRELLRTRRPLFQVGRSLLMLAMPASWVLARSNGVHSAELNSVFWLAPLMMLALAATFLRERADARVWGLTLAASLLIVAALEPSRWPGAAIIYPVVMGFTFAAYVVMTRSLRSESTTANLFFTALGVFVPLSALMPKVWITPAPDDLLVMIMVGMLGWVTLLALDRAMAAGPVVVSAPYVYLQIPIGVIAGWMMAGQVPGRRMLVAAFIILTGLIVMWVRFGGSKPGVLGERAT